jgi:hypothetical protein
MDRERHVKVGQDLIRKCWPGAMEISVHATRSPHDAPVGWVALRFTFAPGNKQVRCVLKRIICQCVASSRPDHMSYVCKVKIPSHI